jgi:hypothetical protein
MLWVVSRKSVAVVFRLERAFHGHPNIIGLLDLQLGQLGTDLVQMETGNLLIQMFGQNIDLDSSYSSPLRPELHLRKDLVGEGSRHDEARVTGGVAEIHQTTFG